ncbi:MAG: IclR family transcriptional regulator [Opitutae bacterium]|jgi:DNA-binding IclR family transcriptional regulator|nr:IclR family transcriptional regulator [Opitutae bacterium]
MIESILIRQEASAKGTERTLAILEYLGRFRTGQSSSEIARALNLPVNSVGRITETMNTRGWLYRKEDDRRYVLTNRVADLTRPQINDRSLVVSSWDSLKQLRDITGETSQLLVMVEGKAMVLEQCISDQPIKVSGRIGLRVPCYSCAPGKSILAALPTEELETYLREVNLKRFTPRTLVTRSLLVQDLEKIRSCGYALDLAEGLEGIHCVSSVILDDYHYPVGAVTVIAPSSRLESDRFEEMGKSCVNAAESIRTELLK